MYVPKTWKIAISRNVLYVSAGDITYTFKHATFLLQMYTAIYSDLQQLELVSPFRGTLLARFCLLS